MSRVHFQGDAFLPRMISIGWNNRYFIDTEFTNFEERQLISLAIVGESGHEFYGERDDFDATHCSEFVRTTVLPQLGRLGRGAMTIEQLRIALRGWLACIPVMGNPVLCYDLEADIGLLRELLGGELPSGWAIENVAARIDSRRRAAYFARYGGEHHALHDARATAFACIA